MADEQPAKRPKRRVKNPETFRERAIKAAETSGQPKRATRIKGVGGKIASPVVQPIGLGARTIFGLKPFRWLGRPLHWLGLLIFPAYFRNSWKELKLVTWPSWRESRRLTWAVLIFAIIFGTVIALVDYGLDKLFKNILLK